MHKQERRLNGLLGAIDKMEESIKRDQDDFDHQQQKIDDSEGQLESELRKARLVLI
ncbi:MAG: hypothetical protein R2771_12555 [Saprospiraceae bacterium]